MRFLRLKTHFPEMRFRAGKTTSRRGAATYPTWQAGPCPTVADRWGRAGRGPAWPGFFFLTLGHVPGRGRRTPRRRLPAIPATTGVVRPTEMRRTERRISGWWLLPPASFVAAATGLAAEQGFGRWWIDCFGGGDEGLRLQGDSPEHGG